MRIQLVLLDSDQEYLRRVTAHLTETFPGRIDVHAYTDIESALQGAAAVRAHAFIADPSFDVAQSSLPGRCVLGRLTDSPSVASIDGVPAVARYTRTSEFFRQVVELVSSVSGSVEIRKHVSGRAPRLVVTTAAAGGVGTSTVAVALARTFAMQPDATNVLYVDLDPTADPGATLLTAGAAGPTLSDVIYAVKRRRGDIDAQLISLMRTDAYGLHHFAATRDPADVLDLTADDRSTLLERLTSHASLDVVVLDMPLAAALAQWSVLENAHRVILVSDGRASTQARTTRAQRMLERLDTTHESNVAARTSLVQNRSVEDRARTSDAQGTLALATLPDLGGVPEHQVVDHIYASGALSPLVSVVTS